MKRGGLRVVFCAMVVGLMTFVIGCQDPIEKENISKYDVIDHKWHLTKFVDIANNNDKLPLQNSENVYWIKFVNDEEFEGHLYSNNIQGSYRMDIDTRSLCFLNIGGTEVYELYDGDKFLNLLSVVQNFHVSGDTLRLLYNNKMNYLQFEKLD